MDFLDRIKKPKFPPEEEKAFRASFAEKNLSSARLIQFQILLIFVAAGYLDYVLLGELATLMMFMRYSFFSPVLLFIVAFTFTKWFQKSMQATFCIAITITSVYVTLFTLLNADAVAMIYFVGSIVIVFVSYVYVPLLFNYALLMAPFIFAICLTGVYFNESFTAEIVEACTLLLMGSMAMALAACYSNERHARVNFQYEKMLNIQKDDLQASNTYLQKLATIDGLTGIANRRAFDMRLDEEWSRAERSKSTLSVLLIDVDFFKLYNDAYGHQKGDECLKKIAKTLEGMTQRAGDFVARYGGEEFVFVVSNSEHENVMAYADSVREKIASLAIPHSESKVANKVTLSIGVASAIPGEITDLDSNQLLRLADRALYQAKSDGRNRVSDLSHLS